MAEFLALEWLPDQLRGLVGPEAERGAVRAAAQLETTDHADLQVPASQAGESLRVWLQQSGLNASETIVVLPREAVVLRRLQLPQVPVDELPDLVRFQAATRTASPIDSLVFDFIPLPALSAEQDQDVICFTLSVEQVNRINAVCEAAKLQVKKITISPLTIGELLRHTIANGLGLERPELVVFQQGDRLELSIFDFGSLILGHSIQLGASDGERPAAERLKPLKSDLARTLIALGQSHPGVELTHCYYVAGTPDADVRAELEQRFPSGFHQLEHAQLPFTGSPAGDEALLGALLPRRDDRMAIDFLHPRKKREIPDRRKWYIGAAAGIVLLASAMAYSVYYAKKSNLEGSITTLKKDVKEKTDALEAGKPKGDAFARLDVWQESNSDPLELWNQLRSLLTDTDRIYFRDMKIVPKSGEIAATFTGNGNARTSADVYQLSQTLSENGYRVTPTTPTQESNDPDYPWKFTLGVDMFRKEVTPSVPPVPSTPKPALTSR